MAIAFRPQIMFIHRLKPSGTDFADSNVKGFY